MDSDYITIKAAIDCVKSVLSLSKQETNALNRYIRMMPAMRIIRCRECYYYENVDYYGGGQKRVCRLFDRQIQENDYCSYGNGREDGDT